MADNFDSAFVFCAQNEGGFDNISDDKGGPTNIGLTYDDMRAVGLPQTLVQIQSLTWATAKPIYEAVYWKPLLLDQVTSQSTSTAMLDICLLNGKHGGVRVAQLAADNCNVKGLTIDGAMGPGTLSALNQVDSADFIKAVVWLLKARYLAIVAKDSTQQKFLAGWNARADRLLSLVRS